MRETVSFSFLFGLETGVAYSLHMVQIFSYHGGEDLRQHHEVNLV